MNVIDSSAWIAYFTNDTNATKFTPPIELLSKLIVPSVTITETYKYILRCDGQEAALKVATQMKQGYVVELDIELAIEAAHFGLEYKLPLADSIIYATAQKYGATIWTQDSHFKGLDNVEFFAKSKSK